MKQLIFIGALVVLAGCGADGEPIQPTANLGVSIGSGGVRPAVGVGVRSGPVSVGVSL